MIYVMMQYDEDSPWVEGVYSLKSDAEQHAELTSAEIFEHEVWAFDRGRFTKAGKLRAKYL